MAVRLHLPGAVRVHEQAVPGAAVGTLFIRNADWHGQVVAQHSTALHSSTQRLHLPSSWLTAVVVFHCCACCCRTVSLLSLILSYQYHRQGGKGKLIYCTRTVQEMDKVVEELRRVMQYREQTILDSVKLAVRQQQQQQEEEKVEGQQPSDARRMDVDMTEESKAADARYAALPVSVRDPRILGVCLSSRRNMCIHSEVSSFDNRNKVDALCRNLTASFIREQHAQGAGTPICEFYEGWYDTTTSAQPLIHAHRSAALLASSSPRCC